jgi:hypothetical protein
MPTMDQVVWANVPQWGPPRFDRMGCSRFVVRALRLEKPSGLVKERNDR